MKNNYMPQLDGLRTFAVIFVMLNHWVFTDAKTLTIGYTFGSFGVDMFYVLSGFLISLILIDNKEKITNNAFILKQFYIRRFLRIFPLYYFVILVGVLLKIPGCRQYIIYLIAYLANIAMIPSHGDLGNFSHMWSLSVEEQFYIIFPIALIAVKGKNIKWLAILMILIGILSRTLSVFWFTGGDQFWFAHCFTSASFDSFGLGLLLAYNLYYRKATLSYSLKKYSIYFFLPSIIITVYTLYTHYDAFLSDIFIRFSFSITAYWIVGTAATNNFRGFAEKIITNKQVSYLGRITYGLYVYHYIVPFFFKDTIFRLDVNIQHRILYAPVFFITTVILAAISFNFFENPVNKLKKRFEYGKS